MRKIILVSIFAGALLFFDLRAIAQTHDLTFDGLPTPGVGTPLPAFIKEAVRLAHAGDQDAPVPMVWVAPQKLKRGPLEWLIVLSPDEYGKFLGFIKSYPCPPGDNKWGVRGTLQVTEFNSGSDHIVCTMPPAIACEFMSTLSNIPVISSTPARLKTIRDLAETLKFQRRFDVSEDEANCDRTDSPPH